MQPMISQLKCLVFMFLLLLKMAIWTMETDPVKYISCVFAVHHKCFNTTVLRELRSPYFKPVHRARKKKKKKDLKSLA